MNVDGAKLFGDTVLFGRKQTSKRNINACSIKVDMGLLLELLILADQIRATIKKCQLIVSTIGICEEGIKTKTAIVHCKNKNTSTRLKQWGTQDKQID